MTEGKKKENELITITEAIMSGLSDYLAAELKADDEKEATEIVRRIISAPPTPAEPAGEELREHLKWYADTFCELGNAHECCGRMSEDDCSGCRARAALAAAPQPAPADREAMVVAIGQASDPPLTYEACERLADALLARGLRLPGAETMAWAVQRENGTVRPGSVATFRRSAGRSIKLGERVVRVSIRVVDDAGKKEAG